MFVLITLKLLFLVSVLLSLIRSRVFRSFFSMAEGGCEKFPDHWNTEFFSTVIVEYISHGCPVDILIKRWVMTTLLFSFSFFVFIIVFFFFYNWIFNMSISLFRIFLSYKSRKLALESELSTNPNVSNSCGCAPSDGPFPRASDPTCEFVRRREVFKFLW